MNLDICLLLCRANQYGLHLVVLLAIVGSLFGAHNVERSGQRIRFGCRGRYDRGGNYVAC